VIEEISDLQVRISFQEDYIETLNTRVSEQQTEIDQLKFQVNYLSQKLQEVTEKAMSFTKVSDEKPPHY